MSMVKAVNLCHKYNGKEVLKNISLEIAQGKVFALIGPTGTGKTTFLRLINLIEQPVSGKIFFDGTDTAASGKTALNIRRKMAFVLQKPVMFNASVHYNIACGLKWRKIEKTAIQKKVKSIIALVGLEEYESRNAKMLSGGEAQLVALARALAVEPEVLLLDEPTANLDPISVSKIEKLISDINRQCKTTIIISTHEMSQGRRLADRIGVLINGEIVQTGSSGEVFEKPGNRDVAEFVGMENIIDGVIVSSDNGLVIIEVKKKQLEAIANYDVGENVTVCIRPEEVMLSLSKITSSARNNFCGKVSKITIVGQFVRVEIDCGFQIVSTITKRSLEDMRLKIGIEVYAAFKATGVHVFKNAKG